MLVVDQMRADYLETYAHRWQRGIATLRDRGAVFERAEYPYLNTVTCAGHATIGTGTLPHTPGRILNAWWDRERRALVSCTDDPASPAIPYGGRSAGTYSGRALRAATFADRLRAHHPGSRIVSLSLKPRSAIGLVGQAATAIVFVDDQAQAFATARAFATAPDSTVREFLRRAPHTADYPQPWTLSQPEASYRYPDANAYARPPATQSGLFPHRVPAARQQARAAFAAWQTSPFSDAYLARMAVRLVDAHQLGQRAGPDVLAVSFSALDLIGHAYGPRSREVEDTLARLDETIGTLIEALDAKVGRDRYLLALTADHGVADIPQTIGAARIASDDVRERVEEALVARFGAGSRPPRGYVANVTFTNVYLADGVWNRLRADDDAWRQVEAAVLDLPGVARLLRADRLDAHSRDNDIRAAALSFTPDRSGDLIVVTRAGWIVGPRAEAAATTHGSGHPYDRHVPLILMGAGVKPGLVSAPSSPADIAPTFAHVAGIAMPGSEGRVLREAFEQPPAR